MPRPLFLHQLDAMSSRGCDTPFCAHEHGAELYLTPRCHPGCRRARRGHGRPPRAPVWRYSGAALLEVSSPGGRGRPDHACRPHPGVSAWARVGRTVQRGESDGKLPALPCGSCDDGGGALRTCLMALIGSCTSSLRIIVSPRKLDTMPPLHHTGSCTLWLRLMFRDFCQSVCVG